MAEFDKASPLAPFRVRSFRFQWPADLLTSWAFEMETLILGWYILVETESVLWLTAFGSLQFLGTLVAPMVGVIADRIGRRIVLCSLRVIYALLASILMMLALSGLLSPYYVFAVALMTGLVRPSDLVMRNSLIGDTMPSNHLMNAMGVSRTTQDSARIAGALIGASLFSFLGFGTAYIVVTSFYAMSFVLTLGVSKVRPVRRQRDHAAVADPSPWRELKEGLAYVWATPNLLAAMWLAFLVNLTAFPLSHGLLPYVAKEIYAIDENGLGHLVAAFAAGALLGSLAMASTGGSRRPGQFMLINVFAWFAVLLIFGQVESKLAGLGLLFAVGLFQSLALISMSVTLLSTATPEFRGRVMGVRMLAVYGLPLGLMASSLFIGWFGYAATVVVYCLTGAFLSLLVAFKWRRALWR